jgi:hypothetical protein
LRPRSVISEVNVFLTASDIRVAIYAGASRYLPEDIFKGGNSFFAEQEEGEANLPGDKQ